MLRKALGYLMFIKLKRCGEVKSRGYVDGRPKRLYISKEEESSPTVATHALMASCLMDAIERRKVVTIDLTGAFLQADWSEDNKCYIEFEGVMVETILKINPRYNKYVKESASGRKFLYGRVSKAIYGTLLGSRLFYDKLTGQIKDWGFEQNNYDECTWNTTVEGEQLTCQFHVDDLKLSHVNQKVLDAFVEKLKSVFGKEDELSENNGEVHEYLGVTIHYNLPGKVAFTMFEYLEDIIIEAPEDLKPGRCVHPCNGNLFKIKEDSPLLDPERADSFHRLVARLLFTSKRTRPDIQVTVEDYQKLGKLIGYVKETIDLPLILGSDGSETLTWNVYASYATHADARSHSGASLTIGQGSVISMSRRQKLVSRSSTESELIGLDNAMTFVMWENYFFEE